MNAVYSNLPFLEFLEMHFNHLTYTSEKLTSIENIQNDISDNNMRVKISHIFKTSPVKWAL